jgi:hypothetical protein
MTSLNHETAQITKQFVRFQTGSKNLFAGNGDWGVKCRENSSIWPTESQLFTGGNTPDNVWILPHCRLNFGSSFF